MHTGEYRKLSYKKYEIDIANFLVKEESGWSTTAL